ncbi:NAD(P)/FAD-dependent oxidoreductase [Kitasatospora sp. NPDC088346]|uniref:NAD(P)/FAD-dependent oxidoreductase n=1 Tax=Kitasatospora sp. NPDC088346 TaxID=3364073 RepID=UPI0037FC7D88
MASSGGAHTGRYGTAVVIGGGLAGCLAAWALRGKARRIVVVERDRYPQQPGPRPGTPQGHHAHLLLEGGRRALEDLLPGIGAELDTREARLVEVPEGMSWLSSAGWMPRFRSGLAFLSCTRPVLDHTVLERVRCEPSIEFLEGTAVLGVLGDAEGLTGVRVRTKGADDGGESEIHAELVVDASGRSSAMPDWLAAAGFAPAPEERVDPGVAYASRLYHRPAGADPDMPAVYLQTKAPDQPRFGVLLPVEGDRWLVTVGGMRGAEPVPGEAGFAAELERLRDPLLRDLVAGAEPAGEVRGFRPGPGVRRHYQRRSPDGLVVVGDAACTFNPVYGQGISTAVFGARALRDAVRAHGIGRDGAREARRGIAAAAADAWLMSSSEDVRFPTTTGGPTGTAVRIQHRYLDRVIARAAVDEGVCLAFVAVMGLTRPPTTLFHPKVLWSVLRGT